MSKTKAATPKSPSSSDQDELFDPTFLAKLRSLFFQLRNRRQLQKRGAQPTPATGFTREFKDHRHYTPGDDYREIDWKLYARLERLFIRLFEEVQEFNVHVIVDTSASMIDPHPYKRVVALRLAAALSYLAMINGHRVSMLTLSDKVTQDLPPLKGQGHIHNLLRYLAELEYGEVTQFERSLHAFRPSRDRKGIAFLISDLFGRSIDDALGAVRAMGRWPMESHVIQIAHPEEVRPNFEGELQLLDVETGEAPRMWLTKRDMDFYTKAYEQFTERIHQTCASHQMNHLLWTTDHPFEEMFMQLLARGSALAGNQ